MHRLLAVIFLAAMIGSTGCEKADQTLETLEKAKALKSDVEKTVGQVKKDLSGKAEEIKAKALKEAGTLLDREEEKTPGKGSGKKGPAKQEKED